MSKKLALYTFFSWLTAIVVWQYLFYNHPIVSSILWEIDTILTSVILFYIVLNFFVNDDFLDFIKICFRIVFKVWLIIFITFAMQKSFNQKGFVLTTTFVFGYLEGLIDINAWLRNKTFSNQTIEMLRKSKKNNIALSIISISIVHLLCAFIALLFFNI